MMNKNMIQSNEIIQSGSAETFSKLMGGDKNALLREASFAIQIAATNPKIQECSKESIIKAVWNIAACGLTLNPLMGLAYLTPRFTGGKTECVLMPSYKGLQKLAQETGVVRKVESRLVYEGDTFDVTFGTRPDIIHKPVGKKETIIAAYAVATLESGEIQFEVMMKEELDEIRGLSDSWKALEAGKIKSAIWKDHEGEMCRKTVIKRLLKYLPKVESQRLQEAIKLDNRDFEASSDQKNYIESLLRSSTYDHEYTAQIENNLEDITAEQASAIIADLKNNQQSFEQTGVGNMSAIQKQLDTKTK
jgi:phage RecT family recombinase